MMPSPDEFVEEAAVLFDDFAHGGEVAVEPCENFLGGDHAGGCGGEVADVGEEDGGYALFALLGLYSIAIFPDFGGYVGGNASAARTGP